MFAYAQQNMKPMRSETISEDIDYDVEGNRENHFPTGLKESNNEITRALKSLV